MKKFLLMALVAIPLFACNKHEDKQDNQDPTKGENTVTLSVKQEALTKGITDEKGNPEYSVIGSAKIFFINGSGTNVYQRELTTAEIAALTNTTTTPGDKTVTITGVPNTATTLYFIANIKTGAGTGFPMADGSTPADARLRIDKLQADVIQVPMAGQSGAFIPITPGSRVHTASVTLTPVVARFELGQITCQNQNGAGQPAVNADITGYKLSGVFMNNIHQNVLLSGAPYLVGAPLDIRSQSGWTAGYAAYFNPANTVFPYYVGGSPAAPVDWVANAMSDFCTPTGANALSFYPDVTNGATSTEPTLPVKKAWAYQVVPSKTVAMGDPADVPHLILKLTDVTYLDNPLGLPTKYITVDKYIDVDSNAPVLEFKRGHVYRIENLIFTHNETTNVPYEENITVTATVSVAPWVIKNIVPDWN